MQVTDVSVTLIFIGWFFKIMGAKYPVSTLSSAIAIIYVRRLFLLQFTCRFFYIIRILLLSFRWEYCHFDSHFQGRLLRNTQICIGWTGKSSFFLVIFLWLLRFPIKKYRDTDKVVTENHVDTVKRHLTVSTLISWCWVIISQYYPVFDTKTISLFDI